MNGSVIYVINLMTRVNRLLHIVKELKRAEILEYQIFKAIDGRQITEDIPIKRGAMGCLLSHLAVLQEAKQKELSSVIVVEDDTIFHPNFIKLCDEWLRQVPDDWQMLYFGGNNTERPLEMITENVGRCKRTLSTVCYVIRDSVYDLVIEEVSKKDKLLDLIYAERIQPKINAYCFSPSLVRQLQGYSDVMEKEIDYKTEYDKW